MTLKELEIGKSAVVTQVGGEGALRQHFLDMGMIPGAEVTVVKFAPMGDPMELQIHGYELTLRLAEAEQIEIKPIDKRSNSHAGSERIQPSVHPGLGEEGKFHSKEDEHPLPEGTTLTYALVGNQNCGKTTLFNQLTGANQHVGNFPGVTVDRKDGAIKGYSDTNVTDLPGIYSMSPYSSEEIVSRNFVLQDHPTAIINIVDATNIERNLYLTMQLLEMDIPMVVALNMMDEVTSNHGAINVNLMEELLGVPVIPISAAKNEGVEELVKHALHIAKYQERPMRQDFCDKKDHDGSVHRCIHAVIHLIEDHAEKADIPVRFAATKAIEGDLLILKQLKLDENEKEMLEHIVCQMETERGVDRSAAIADMVGKGLKAAQLNDALYSLIMDGIFTGVGSVLSFLPIIVTLFFFLSLMEDSGYIARVAFVMDKLLRKIGLSGKSIVPLLIGFGCTVPAVMATRTLTSERDRKMTILLTPFMSCTAKLPIYAFFVSVFFPGRGGLIMTGLYLFGIVMGILVAFLYRATLFEGEPVPFVMELPNYRLPGVRNVGQLLWEKAKDFLQKAFSVILVATVVVWFLQSFNLRLNMVSDSSDSMLAMIAQIFVPILTPLGLGDWRIATALISGVMAKESVVSTLEVLFSGSISTVLSPLTAGSLLVFSLLYTPCIAAIASVKRELGSKWAVSMVIWQCIVAWVAAFAVYLIGGLL